MPSSRRKADRMEKSPHSMIRWLILSVFLLPLAFPLLFAGDFNSYILRAVAEMPSGGGYASDRAAEIRLARRGVVWDERGKSLVISPQGASPTFCSAACYMVLLRAMRTWEREEHRALSAELWRALRVEETHPDGTLSWGRFNANGPGCAVWVHDLRAGVNFSSLSLARPGDFLKFFFTEQLGAGERGHLVVFMGTEQRDGELCIRFWSSNKPDGYGSRSVPLRSMHHLIFTRITEPYRIQNALRLPPFDPWLGSLLHSPTDWETACRRCGIIR